MLQRLLILVSLFVLPFTMQAQLGNLMNKAKSKIKQRVDNKVDNAMDNTLDEVEGKGKKGNSASTETGNGKEGSKNEAAPSVVSYSKFDFVPGERVIYSEDFSQDAIGELPVNWNASGKGEVVTIDGQLGKWLQLFGNTSYLSGNKKVLGENFTVEFDLIYRFYPKHNYVMPNLVFGLFSSGTTDNTDNSFLKEHRKNINALEITIYPYGTSTGVMLRSYKDKAQSFVSDRVTVSRFPNYFNKVAHYSIQVQKQRFRLWLNEEKLFDIPRAVNTSAPLNQLFFFLEGSNYTDGELGLYVTNLKLATGVPDTRHKLVEEGKFSTTGILFDSGSDIIKPQSFGVLKEVAQALKDNPDIKVKIVGHTDSDGNDKSNLELSNKRAGSVKAALEKEFGIDGRRLQFDGKGETQPVADNKTKEGKMQNRRVEFIKL